MHNCTYPNTKIFCEMLLDSLLPPFHSDTKNCKTCDRVQSILETRQTDLADAGIRVVKLADRKTAKQNGVLTFPGLTFFKAGKGHNFEGEVGNKE